MFKNYAIVLVLNFNFLKINAYFAHWRLNLESWTADECSYWTINDYFPNSIKSSDTLDLNWGTPTNSSKLINTRS